MAIKPRAIKINISGTTMTPPARKSTGNAIKAMMDPRILKIPNVALKNSLMIPPKIININTSVRIVIIFSLFFLYLGGIPKTELSGISGIPLNLIGNSDQQLPFLHVHGKPLF